MTETDCFNCDYSENCDWTLITVNTVPMTPPCIAKAWHKASLHTFGVMTEKVRARIVSVGDDQGA